MEMMVYLNEFQRGLRPKRILGRHVEVIHEGEKFLSSQRHIHPLSSLLYTGLNDVLHIVRGCLSGHVYCEHIVSVTESKEYRLFGKLYNPCAGGYEV